jgi:hypothetical protein
MQFYRAATGAAALGLIIAFSGAPIAYAATAYNVSGPADHSNVAPSTAVLKSSNHQRMSADKAVYKKNPQDIGTPAAVGAPGATAMRDTEAGPSVHAPKKGS